MDDRKRMISIMIACIVAMLVMMIGKACNDKMYPQTKKSNNATNINTPAYTPNNYQQPIQQQPEGIPQQTEVYEYEEPQVEYVTDMLGRVVETIPIAVNEEPENSEFGYNSEYSDTVAEATTEYKSLLDQYYEQQAAGNNGFNNNVVQPVTESNYVIPDSVSIVID